MSYQPLSLMTVAARKTSLPRLCLGVLVILVASVVLQQGIFSLPRLFLSEDDYADFLGRMLSGGSPAGMFVMLLTMGTLGLGCWVAARLVHGRSGRSLGGPWPLGVAQFLSCVVILVPLYLGIGAVQLLPMSGEMLPGLPAGQWLMLLIPTLLALLIQTGSEELLFRGYLQSQLAARLPHPAAWLILPSALFALGHYAPGVYGGNALLVALWAFAFGLAAADLTARSGTIGPALALHFANNLLAIAVVSPQGQMSGLALWQLPFDATDEAAMLGVLPLDLLGILVGWLATRLALRV